VASWRCNCFNDFYQEYPGVFWKNRALRRRFQKIDVLRTDVQMTPLKILNGILNIPLWGHHSVRYSPQKAIAAAAELSAKSINTSFTW